VRLDDTRIGCPSGSLTHPDTSRQITHHSTNHNGATTRAALIPKAAAAVKDKVPNADTTARIITSAQAEKWATNQARNNGC